MEPLLQASRTETGLNSPAASLLVFLPPSVLLLSLRSSPIMKGQHRLQGTLPGRAELSLPFLQQLSREAGCTDPASPL